MNANFKPNKTRNKQFWKAFQPKNSLYAGEFYIGQGDLFRKSKYRVCSNNFVSGEERFKNTRKDYNTEIGKYNWKKEKKHNFNVNKK